MSLDYRVESGGDTNTTVKGDLTVITDNAPTTFEHSKEAPATKRRMIMANNEIGQTIKGEVSRTKHAHMKASTTLLDLPTEIRLQICEVAFHDIFDIIRSLPLLEGLIERPPCTGALALSYTSRTLRLDNIKSVQSLVKTYKLRVHALQKLLWQAQKEFKTSIITSKRYDQVIQDNYHIRRSLKLLECCLKRWNAESR